MNLVWMAILLAFIVIAVTYAAFVLPTQWLKVEHVAHPVQVGARVLQVSDLHVEKLRVSPQRLRRVIEEEQVDFIFLTGDFLDKIRYFPRLAKYLAVFRDSGVPVYAVLGNHDYKVRQINDYVRRIESYGVTVLRNRCVRLPGFDLIGIDDHYTGRSDVARAFQLSRDGVPKIVITHDPNVVLVIRRPFDYLMAGHLHGKQFNVPGLYRLHPMGQLPAQGIYKGLHRSEYGVYYISKGVGQVGFNARFLVRSEVTVHAL